MVSKGNSYVTDDLWHVWTSFDALSLFFHLTLFIIFFTYIFIFIHSCFMYCSIFIPSLSLVFISFISILSTLFVSSILTLSLSRFLSICGALVSMHILPSLFVHFSKSYMVFLCHVESSHPILSNFMIIYSHYLFLVFCWC